MNSPATPSRSLHILSWLTACAVFPLIFLGGMVTTHHAGLAVPDWPNSYGYNMFLFPVSQWRGGIFFEHTHRLLATGVGFLSILLVLQAYAPAKNQAVRYVLGVVAGLSGVVAAALGSLLFLPGASTKGLLSQVAVGFAAVAVVGGTALLPRNADSRPWVRRLSLAVLGAVLFQGLLGGLRVKYVNLNLAIVHGCFAQAFFCLTALMVIVTSEWWQTASNDRQGTSTLARWALAAVVIVYLQLVAGATMRHFDAGLAIPDFPLSYGHALPPTSADTLPAINLARASDPLLRPVTMFQIWLHFTHRIGALLVTITLTGLVIHVRKIKSLATPAIGLIVLLITQLTLGILTVLLRKRAEVATAHVAVGALTLVTTFTIFIRSLRLYGWPSSLVRPAHRLGSTPVASHA